MVYSESGKLFIAPAHQGWTLWEQEGSTNWRAAVVVPDTHHGKSGTTGWFPMHILQGEISHIPLQDMPESIATPATPTIQTMKTGDTLVGGTHNE